PPARRRRSRVRRGKCLTTPFSFNVGGQRGRKADRRVRVSLISGIFILLGGAVIAAIGATIFAFVPALGLVLGVIGLASGVLVLGGAIMLYMHTEQHVTWGIIILVFSILSIFTSLGGFLIGLILEIIAGALGNARKPQPMPFPGYLAGYPAGFR